MKTYFALFVCVFLFLHCSDSSKSEYKNTELNQDDIVILVDSLYISNSLTLKSDSNIIYSPPINWYKTEIKSNKIKDILVFKDSLENTMSINPIVLNEKVKDFLKNYESIIPSEEWDSVVRDDFIHNKISFSQFTMISPQVIHFKLLDTTNLFEVNYFLSNDKYLTNNLKKIESSIGSFKKVK